MGASSDSIQIKIAQYTLDANFGLAFIATGMVIIGYSLTFLALGTNSAQLSLSVLSNCEAAEAISQMSLANLISYKSMLIGAANKSTINSTPFLPSLQSFRMLLLNEQNVTAILCNETLATGIERSTISAGSNSRIYTLVGMGLVVFGVLVYYASKKNLRKLDSIAN